jgi:predicted SprT family Zn-dependent metalloprotease
MSDVVGRRDFEQTNRLSDDTNSGDDGGLGPAPIWEAPGRSDCNAHHNKNCDAHSTGGQRCDVHSNDIFVPAGENGPTQQTYREIQAAFDYLDLELFEGKLQAPLITYQRRKGTYGYYAEKRFGREDGGKTDEIALNPQHIAGRPIEETLATLGHEMVHLWQHHFGTSGRGGYHNAEWASVMESIGLIPSHTGKEGGKRTGDRVTQYIEPGGRFAVAVEKLLATGFTITWRELPGNQLSDGKFGRSGSLSGLRFKFSCPDCGDAAWGKSDLYLVCGKHAKRMLPGDGKPAPVTQNPDRNINSTSSSRVDDIESWAMGDGPEVGVVVCSGCGLPLAPVVFAHGSSTEISALVCTNGCGGTGVLDGLVDQGAGAAPAGKDGRNFRSAE